MFARTYLKIATLLTLAGVLFSGYLSFKKYFTGTCAFNESCPTFLGHPACWYGLGMFSLMFLVSLLAWAKVFPPVIAKWFNAVVAFAGILFAGHFAYIEVLGWTRAFTPYTLGLPTCVYGLVFYILIFVISICYLKPESSQS